MTNNTVLEKMPGKSLARTSVNNHNIEALKKLSSLYPYSTPLRIILARKLHDEKSEALNAEQHYLYFYNPLWLDHQADPKGEAIFKQTDMTHKTGSISDIVTPTDRITEPHFEEKLAKIEIEKVTPPVGHSSVEEIGEPVQQLPEAIQETGEELPDLSSDQDRPENFTVQEPENEQLENGPQPEKENEIPPQDLPNTVPVENKEPELQKPSSLTISFQSAQPVETELSFEPYHTVDYFASQGIKFAVEELPKDKFGKQLKSFTEWLKTLKKPQPGVAAPSPANPGEKKVEEMAEHSIEDREVVTETMAEVWEKQGKPEKAIAIYRKLSLINPSKSAYFAAKIDHLKQS